jgi:outer membrane protein assembly factor BamE (lipoprotein component of BamABCDE complex)
MGNENLKAESVTQIVKGKTTKSELLALLGPPQSITTRTLPTQAPGSPALPAALMAAETWMYWSHNIEGSAVVLPFYASTTSKSSNYIVTIYIDNGGMVMDYATSATNSTTGF